MKSFTVTAHVEIFAENGYEAIEKAQKQIKREIGEDMSGIVTIAEEV